MRKKCNITRYRIGTEIIQNQLNFQPEKAEI